MNTRPNVSEIDKLLMKYLQNPPVRRFQSGGPAENPEADYFLTEDDKAEDPTYDPSNIYTGRKNTHIKVTNVNLKPIFRC